jgi:predicted ArsR family transcriptional regulator
MRSESREAVERYDFLKSVVQYVAMNPGATIPEIVKSTKYSYTAVKRALNELVEQEFLKCERRVVSKRGRPAIYYTLSKPFTIISPPRQYQYLSKMIVQGLIEQLGIEGVKNFFAQLGASMGAQAAKTVETKDKNLSITQISKLIERYFNDYGGSCKVRSSDNGVIVDLRNCVFFEVSKEYEGIICEAHETFFKSFLDSLAGLKLESFSHGSCMARGDKSCVFELRFSK